MHRILLLAICGLSPWTAFAQGALKGPDVNDVAVLFPLDAARQPFPAIHLGAAEEGQDLVPSPVFDDVIQAAGRMHIAAPAGYALDHLRGWRLVSFRYDPCAPGDVHGTGELCAQELRLVAQPFNQDGPADTALHLLYHIGEGETAATEPVLGDLLALKFQAEDLTKTSTAGRPLGVHPLLSLALKNGDREVGRLYEDFIRRHAQPRKLKRVTMMGLKEGQSASWVFFGGDVRQDRWQLTGIPNLSQDGSPAVALDLNATDNVFAPVPLDILKSTFGFFHREKLVEGEIEVIRSALHAFENPVLSNRNTLDCLTCHSATSLRLHPNTRSPAFVQGLTSPVPKGITAFPEPGVLPRHRLHWNLRAFGYFGVQPTVSLRTVNETGRVALQVNQITQRTPSGPDCSGSATRVMSCVVDTIPGPSLSLADIVGKCLNLCQKAEDTGLVPGHAYAVVARSSGKCLDIPRQNSVNGVKILQKSCSADPFQKFRVDPVSEGTYQLVHVETGKCLDVSGVSKDNGALLQLWDCHGGSNQKVSLLPVEGAYNVRFQHSGKCLDVKGKSLLDGASLQQWACHSESHQQWMLQPD